MELKELFDSVEPCLGQVDVHHSLLKVHAIGMMQFKDQYYTAKQKVRGELITFLFIRHRPHRK
jgi:hypothetical protein